MKRIISLILLIFVSMAYTDIVYLKNGLKIEGEIISVTSDSVTIKTSSGVINIAEVDIDSVKTILPEEPNVVREAGIPKSIKQVGYGCLGGVVGGAGATMITVWAEGFNDAKVATTVIAASVIIGILVGAAVGAGK